MTPKIPQIFQITIWHSPLPISEHEILYFTWLELAYKANKAVLLPEKGLNTHFTGFIQESKTKIRNNYV